MGRSSHHRTKPRRSATRRRSSAARQLSLEALESRCLCTTTPSVCELPIPHSTAVEQWGPSVIFDPVAGLLTIRGDSADNQVRQGLTADGFLVVTIDGESRSARPDAPLYDASLAGATRDNLRRIVLFGGGGDDHLVMADQRLADSLEVESDGDLKIVGSLQVGRYFQANAKTIEVAGSIVVPSGVVRLLSTTATLVTGTIDVAAGEGGVGGRAEILGPVVALLESAEVNASGALGGGVVLVGGDFQGHNPNVPNAQHTFVSASSELRVDALASGQGGRVIVWANAATRFYGSATARGGSLQGDGGLVEVSGKEYLEFRGSTDLSTAGGQIGTLLLDPTDLVIANGTVDSAADGTGTFAGSPSGIVGSILAADTGPSTIYESELQGLAATANIVLQATNNVTINDLSDNTLALAATTGSLTIRADADGNGTGSFSMNSSDTIRTRGGAVSIRGASLTNIGTINSTGNAGIGGGSVTLTADAGVINVVGAISTTGGTNANGGAVTLTASGTLTVSGTITASGGAYLAGNPGRNAGAVSLTGSSVSAAAITTAGTSATSGGNSGGSGGSILLDATAGSITLGGNLSTTGGNGNGVGVGGNAGGITLSDAVVLTGNRVLSAAGGTGGTVGAGGGIQLLGSIDGNVVATRTLTLTGGTGDVTIAGAAGATTSLSALTITGNDISLANIGGASAGVSGATSVTATTAGADTGSIAFTGTTYNANTQTYTAPSGQNLLVNAGAATTFTSTADAVNFTTGTLRLADGSNLVVTTAGGAISAQGGIRGTSVEAVTLNAGATTLAVGAIGGGNEIASVALTATTATLNGDIITGDAAGNNVTITGAVTLNHTAGTTLTIDTDNATSDGAISITGTVTGAARHLSLVGGTISTAAITTTGGSNQDGGSVTMTASGTLTVSGTITASGGTYLAGNPGRNAGAISLAGSSVSVAAITATGTAATSGGNAGGSGGSIVLDATAGSITLGGNLTTTGGNGNGSGAGGNAGGITLSDAVVLTGNRVFTSVGGTGGAAGGGGNIQLLGTVNGNVAATRTLTLTGGTGDVTIAGAVGATTSLSAVTITGNDISLASIGGASAGVSGATSVTAATSGSDSASILLSGVLRTTGTQTYTGAGVTTIDADLLTTNATITFGSAVVLAGDASLAAGTGSAAFNSTVDLGANELAIAADEVDFAANVTGVGGTLEIQSGTTGAQLRVGGAGTAANRLDLTSAELALLQPGLSRITLGRSDSTAAVTVNAVNLTDPTTIRGGSALLTVAGSVTSASYLELSAGTGGIVLNGAVSLGTGNLTLGSGGGVTQAAAISASGLELLGAGTFTLSLATNDVGALAANIEGSINFRDASDLTVSDVQSTVGITTGGPGVGGSVTINAAGFLTVDQTIDTSTGSGGTLTTTGTMINAAPVLGAGDIVLSGLNHAPGLSGANNLAAINEDDGPNSGTLAATVLSGFTSDLDAGALSGMAVTSVDDTSGQWEYSINGGANWTAFGSPAPATARLLAADAQTRIRFVPNPDFRGAVVSGITLRAWDQSAGVQGGTADVTTNGGTTAFSAATATAGINVAAVNDPPAGSDSTMITLEDTPYTFSAADFGFSDPQDSPHNSLLAVLITSLPTAGTLAIGGVMVTAGQSIAISDINSGNLRFTPAVDGNGVPYASFTFQVQDDGGTASGGIDLDPTPNTLTIDITAVDDTPAGTDGTVTTLEESTYVFLVADFGFSDPQDSPANNLLAVRITTLPSAGALANGGVAVTAGQLIAAGDISGGNLRFTPAADASGISYASFTFQVQDDGGTANGGVDLDPTPNVLTIDVVPVNDPPAGADRNVTTLEDAPYVYSTADFGFTDASDSPGHNLLAVRITTLPVAGALTNGGVAVVAGQMVGLSDISVGNLQFTPVANEGGSAYASFTFQVQDDGGTAGGGVDLDFTSNTLTIDVTAVNDPPAGSDNTVVTLEDTPYTFTAADFGFSDPQDSLANNLLAVRITTLPSAGPLTNGGVAVTAGQSITVSDISSGNLLFAPAADANGAAYASFTFQVQDDGGTANGGVDLDPTASTLTIEMTAVNDAPLAADDSYATSEDVPLVVAASGVLANDRDVESTPLSAVLVSGPTSGTLLLNPDGSFSYTPTTGFSGTDSFRYRASDGAGDSNLATVTITVQPVSHQIIAIGSASGPAGASRPTVHVYDAATNELKFVIPASATYGVNNRNGIRVAVADIDGDGFADIITAPGRSTRPDIKIFRGTPHGGLQGTLLATIPAASTFGNAFIGGVNLAVGDVDGDGAADIVLAPDQGQATIKVFHNRRLESPTGSLFVQTRSFDAFADLKNYSGGGRLAVGNLAGGPQSARELVVATGAGTAGKFRLFDLTGASPVRMWTRSDPTGFTGGLFVATGDVNGNGIDDIVTSTGPNGSGRIRVYNHGGSQLATFLPFAIAENQKAAVQVTLRDIDGDGRAELFATQGQDGQSGYKVKKFNPLTAELVDLFFATGPDFAGGGLSIG
jgi:hypothetical protein